MAIIKVRKLDKNYDVCRGNGNNDFLYDLDATVQLHVQRLRLWRGEWFLDTDDGMPWLQLLGKPNEQEIEFEFKKRLLETPGIAKITKYEHTHDTETREFLINYEYQTIFDDDYLAAQNADVDSAALFPWLANSSFDFKIRWGRVSGIWRLNESILNVSTFLG